MDVAGHWHAPIATGALPHTPRRFLVPADLTCAQFGFLIRRRLSLPPEKALFLFINGALPSGAALMREAYELHKDRDGFLYVQYHTEATFGSFSSDLLATRVTSGLPLVRCDAPVMRGPVGRCGSRACTHACMDAGTRACTSAGT